jgi:iron complex outermembrane receptor protein
MRLSIRCILLAAACGAIVCPRNFATAADAAAGDQGEELTEVVVTAERRTQSLLEAPVSVQAIEPDQIEKLGANTVTDLVQAIPGASVVASNGAGFDTIQIRGIASGNFGDTLIGYYIDDTAFNIPNIQLVPPVGLLDLARVEVIRGPSGTLYGQGAMGGTIKLVTIQPDSHAFSGSGFAEGSITDGGAGNSDVGAVFNLPLVEGRLAVRASGEYNYLSGYASAPEANRGHANDVRSENARITGLWTPSDDISVSAFYWHNRSDQDYFNLLSTIRPAQILGTGTRPAFSDVRFDAVGGTLNWRSEIADVVASSSYFDHRLAFDEPDTIPVPVAGAVFRIPYVVDDTFKTHEFTQEIRVTSKDGSPVKWLLGGYYSDATINNDLLLSGDYSSLGIGNLAPINATGPLTTRTWSGYGEASVPLLDGRLEPLVGLRYFSERRSFQDTEYATLPRGPGIVLPELSATDNSVNPRFNLSYKITNTGLIYANVAKGFRGGTIQTQAQATASNTALGLAPGTIKPQVSPDSLWTYELGTRWQLMNSLLVEASVYHTEWHDIIVQIADLAIADYISVVNAGNARIDGGDFGVVWRTPLPGLTFSANGNVEDARYVKTVPALATFTNIKAGAKLPNVPTDNFSVATDYSHALSWIAGMTGSLDAAYAFRDRESDAVVMTASGAPLKTGTLNDLTLRAGVKKDKWAVDVFVYNALNDTGPSLGQPNAGQTPAVIIPYPRRYGLRISVNY